MPMTTMKVTQTPKRHVNRSGFSQWRYEGESSAQAAAAPRPMPSTMVRQWEHENRRNPFRFVRVAASMLRRHSGKLAGIALAFVVGAAFASGPDSKAVNLQLRERLRRVDTKLKAREGELALTRLELTRLNQIVDNSRRYKIPADLASSIYDIALSEGIDPKIAFSLVDVESDFYHKAVSSKGAIGLAQVMPATARQLQPGIARSELFDRETNLRLGFRFLRDMISYYDGDVSLALTAYNRGPGVVDKIRKKGGDPSNGYARAVIGGER
jgi:soluble lytic murein transglycosylase-like protein